MKFEKLKFNEELGRTNEISKNKYLKSIDRFYRIMRECRKSTGDELVLK